MTQKPDININDEREIRLHKLGELEQAGINAYPAKTIREHTLEQALKKAVGESVSVAGRIMVKREMGKLTFCHLQDASEKMQVVFKQNDIGDDQYTLFTKHIDAGDFIAVQGERFQTQKGEESILVKKWQIVSKALLPLPDKFHGLKDKETRFRKRYLDLIMNRDVFELFKKRSRIISLVREYLNKADFLEVETPALQVLYGGTNAKPFETHINAYDMKMYMRVAPELYLKRLVVGGYERVYEIGKNFRNEGVDQTHNPEFTMIEWYESFIDYNGVMDRAEGLYKFIAKELFGDDMKVPVGDNIVDFKKTWPRVRMVDAIKKYTSYDVENLDEKELKNICTAEKVEIRGSATRGQMIMEIFEKLVTDKLTNPTWIIDYPKEVSPLSKVHRDNPDFVERFECYVMGKEIGDGWSEIINPQTQRDRFENEQQAMKEGDDESHPMDEDFIEALEHGMPPLGGIGVGIDRLVMLFTNKWSIREIIFFPIMKPENYSSTQASGSAAKTDPDAKQIGTSSKNINQTLPISRE